MKNLNFHLYYTRPIINLFSLHCAILAKLFQLYPNLHFLSTHLVLLFLLPVLLLFLQTNTKDIISYLFTLQSILFCQMNLLFFDIYLSVLLYYIVLDLSLLHSSHHQFYF